VTRPENSNPVDEAAFEHRDEESLSDGSLAGLAFTGAVLGLAMLFFVRSFSINSDGEIWPKTVSGLLVLLTGLHLLRSLAMRARTAPRPHDPGAADRVKRRAFTAVWLVALAVVAKLTGFGFATLIFVPAYLAASGVRSLLWIVVVTAFAAGALTVLFGMFAGVPVWEGRL
jgi:hypothetical protein